MNRDKQGRPKALISWSSGKDSAFALLEVLERDEIDVVGALTTVTSAYGRVSMHGVREELLDLQVAQLGLPCYKVHIPSPCPDEVYEREMERMLERVRQLGVTHMIFGDLFLEDIRAYRESQLARAGFEAVFPLWGRPTPVLAEQMLARGLSARLTCVDPRRLGPSFAGRRYDAELLGDLPADVDPCGERGEFHTFCNRCPEFNREISVQVGEIVERDGFWFADLHRC